MGLRGPFARGQQATGFMTGPPRKRGTRAVPVAKRLRLTRALLAAFLTGATAYFRAMPAFEGVWMDTPLTPRRSGQCTQGHALGESHPLEGCADQHEAHALRHRIIVELERRGGFQFSDLHHADEATAWSAWRCLTGVATRVGVPAARWNAILVNAGWTPAEEEPKVTPLGRENRSRGDDSFYAGRGGAE